VVSNGKIFQKLGYRVAYLGIRKYADFTGVERLDAERDMYEEPYPQGIREWFLHMWSVKNIQAVMETQGDVCMVILYNVPFVLLKRVKHALKNTNIKVVYDCTEWADVTDGSYAKRIAKKCDEHFIRTKIADVADGLIVISKRMQQAYAKAKHLLLLPPLVDISDSIWHQTMEKQDDIFEFCFAGILDGNKESLDTIVEAFGNLEREDMRLRIIGITEQEFCDFYPNGRELIKRCRGQVVFMGTRSHAETISYVLSCDCYIFIRQSDTRNNAGFPTKFAESFTCNVPIIATDISDIKSYLGQRDRWMLLENVSVEAVECAMREEIKRGKANRSNSLNETFHYETYEEVCKSWIEEF
jgi:glycosyltransferase involved in cell wall biosynthesis